MSNMDTLKKYYDIKSRYSDTVILFRTNDFYELYEYDAVRVAKVLPIEICHTKIDGIDTVILAFPKADLDTWLPKIVKAGLRVMISD